MNGQIDERLQPVALDEWMLDTVLAGDELAVIVDGERAALVAFDRDGEPRLYALNVPVITPSAPGFLDQLLVTYSGQLHGRPEVVA